MKSEIKAPKTPYQPGRLMAQARRTLEGVKPTRHTMKLTLLVQPDNTPDGKHPGFSSLCPELDVASQGDTEEEARDNLREALELFLEDVDQGELARRLAAGARVSQLDLSA